MSLNKSPKIPWGHTDHLENLYSYKNKNNMPLLGSMISKPDFNDLKASSNDVL